ncbi:MAG: hypothetical protein HUU22_18500 [Phycisphaerae bacterium]|nr:hypothetical protein [Phycisphaerae bacterium]NUQ48007.1 hypothetical protein [Phycisphaerae bacterium]
MAYNTIRDVVIMHGGLGQLSSEIYDDTWQFDGAQWTLLAVGGPLLRHSHAMVYDTGRNVNVMFGGRTTGGGSLYLGDTWELDGNGWTQRSSSGPPARDQHAMAYDVGRGVTVVFGGWTNTYRGDTWEWNGNTWTSYSIPVGERPSNRRSHAMVYDAERGVTVLFGGFNGTYLGDTWVWNGTTWTLQATTGIGARYGHAMYYDAERRVVVLFGGRTAGGLNARTFEWNGNAWTLRSTEGPSAREAHGVAYQTSRGVAILFGGNAGVVDGSTWEFNLPCGCGDLNADGAITAADDLPLFVDVLLSGRHDCLADINGDGIVDGDDILPFLAALDS